MYRLALICAAASSSLQAQAQATDCQIVTCVWGSSPDEVCERAGCGPCNFPRVPEVYPGLEGRCTP